jgi:hypothetical protein
MTAEAALAEGLAEARAFSPTYRGGLTNHLPMALCALSALGGSAAQLRRFSSAYTPRLEPMARAATELPGFLDELARVRAAIAERGREAVLRATIPRLVESIETHAFHGIIRVAYAVRFQLDDEELAHGLAYWASGAEAPRPIAIACGATREDPSTIFDDVRRSALGEAPVRAPLITTRMREVSQRPGFDEAAASLRFDGDTLARLADTSARAYLASGDFTALHGMTGTHAFRVLSPMLADRELGERYLFRALLAAYVAGGAPPVGGTVPTPSLSWPELCDIARERLDDHDVKLTDSAREQSALAGDRLARACAMRRLVPD